MRSRTTRAFWRAFDALPAEEQRRARRAYTLWRLDPSHPSLRFKCVGERDAVFSIRVGLGWPALGYREDGPAGPTITWFWIGSHAQYDRLIGSG